MSIKTFASLCTGFGLMDIGATMAGYQAVWGLEIDPKLAAVAQANLNHKIFVESIVRFNWKKADRPDHLHISPPCQAASVANSKRGETALDIAIAQSCCDALDYYKPDSFTLENVRGYRHFSSFKMIVDKLWRLGYWVNADVLNAADFGVPQDRDRLILRAVKGGFPSPLAHKTERRGWYEAIADLIPDLPESSFAQWQLDRLPEMYKTMLTDSGTNSSRTATLHNENEPSFTVCASALNRKCRAPKAFIVHPTDQRTCPVVSGDRPIFTLTQNQGGNKVKAFVVGTDIKATTRESDRASMCVTAAHGNHRLKAFVVNGTTNDRGSTVTVVNADSPIFTVGASQDKRPIRSWVESGRIVALNSRALARLQTLPNWYELPESPSLAGKGIGNGVPCLMAQKIMEGDRP